MKVSTLFSFNLRQLLLISALLLLTSCGGGSSSSGDADDSGGSGGSTADTTTIITNVSKSIADVISSNIEGVSGAGGDSEALASLLALAEINIADNGDQGLSDDLIALIDDAFDASTAVVTRTDDVITIQPSARQVCDNVAAELGLVTDGDEYNACLQVMEKMRIAITVTSDTSGSFRVSHNGVTIVTIQYSPDELVSTHDLADLFTAISDIAAITDPANPVELPAKLSGATKLTIKKLGVDHGSVMFEVTTAINVVDVDTGIGFSLQPSTLFSIEANGPAGTATITSQLGAISALFPVEVDEISGTEEPGRLTLAGSELTLNITDAGEGFDGSITVGLLDFEIADQSTANFFLDPDFTRDAITGVLTLDTALVMNLEFIDSFGVVGSSGTLDITAPAGTSFLEISGATPFESIFQVKSKSITFEGTGDFVDYNDTIVVGECFDLLGRTDCATAASCVDVSGDWQLAITNVNSTCGAEVDSSWAVSITQFGCNLVTNGLKDRAVSGSVDGDTVVIGPGNFFEDGGTTTATFNMTVSPGGSTMSGQESWTWSDGFDSCANGTSDLAATKQ